MVRHLGYDNGRTSQEGPHSEGGLQLPTAEGLLAFLQRLWLLVL